MSVRALLLAVQDQLRLALGYTSAQCLVMLDGRPPPACGQFFVAVHGGGSQNQARNCLDEIFSLTVTVTVRLPKAPFDRMGSDLVNLAATGLHARCDDVRRALHMNYGVIDLANATILAAAATDVYGFTQALEYQGGDAPGVVPGAWFHAKDEPLAGAVRNLRFGNARRIQPNHNIQ